MLVRGHTAAKQVTVVGVCMFQPLCVCYCWILFTSACLCRQNRMFLGDRRIFLAVFVVTKIIEISQ